MPVMIIGRLRNGNRTCTGSQEADYEQIKNDFFHTYVFLCQLNPSNVFFLQKVCMKCKKGLRGFKRFKRYKPLKPLEPLKLVPLTSLLQTPRR